MSYLSVCHQLTSQISITLLLGLLLGLSGCTETFTTEVDSEQEISDSKGKFDVNLNDGDQFGTAIANIGDLDGDDHIDLAVGASLDDSGGEDVVWDDLFFPQPLVRR